jgi:CheY-like chemotaxis protein
MWSAAQRLRTDSLTPRLPLAYPVLRGFLRLFDCIPREEASVPVKILVADDSVTMRRILELTFAGEDAMVSGVDSGDAAVARAAELRPDIVFADASMASDGYRVAAAIKSTPGLEQTAVIVLASQKHPFDEAKARSSGVDDHVLKPFDTQLVIDKVKQVMGRPRAAVAPGAGAKPAAPPPRPGMPAAPPPGLPQMNAPSMADSGRASRTGTIAFGKAAPTAPGVPSPAQPAARPAASSMAAAAARAVSPDLNAKLDGMGLTSDQVAGVLELTREVVERVVWEVVPELAETIIKEEIRRLTQ